MLAVGDVGGSPRGSRFRELAARIRRDIDRGTLPIGTRLPSIPELAGASGVGINTVRRAMSLLVEEGLLDRRQGSGTFVVATSADSRSGRSIGVIVPSLTYYYPQVIAGIEQAASRQNVDVGIASSSYDIDREMAELERMVESGVDGLLLAPSLHRSPDPAAVLDRIDRIARCAPAGVPYVLIERRPRPAPMDRTSYVCTDTAAGAYAAVAHLAELGRRRIGHIGYLNSAPGAEVFRGFREAVDDLGLEFIEPAVLRKPALSSADVHLYMATCREQRLDAVFCLGDPFATMMIRELLEAGTAVPDDVSVVTFGDELAHLAEIPLTAVSPPKFELGRLATELLIRQLDVGAAAVACQVRLQPQLVIRASCGATPTEPFELVFEATG